MIFSGYGQLLNYYKTLSIEIPFICKEKEKEKEKEKDTKGFFSFLFLKNIIENNFCKQNEHHFYVF